MHAWRRPISEGWAFGVRWWNNNGTYRTKGILDISLFKFRVCVSRLDWGRD